MIALKNSQRSYQINTSLLTTAAAAMIAELGYTHFDLGILICGAKRMAFFNEEYRGKKGPTDILSFPFHDRLVAGEQIEARSADEENLGDIILCPAVIDKKRLDWGRSFDQQCVVLLAHGIAHLLGYDHETDEDYERMQHLENRLLKAAKTVME